MHVHFLEVLILDGLDGLHAQPVDVGRRIVSGQSRQVDTCDGLQKPGSLQNGLTAVRLLLPTSENT